MPYLKLITMHDPMNMDFMDPLYIKLAYEGWDEL